MGADGFTFPHEYRRAYPNCHYVCAHSDSRAHAHHEARADCAGSTEPTATHTGLYAHVDAGTDTNRRADGHCNADTESATAYSRPTDASCYRDG